MGPTAERNQTYPVKLSPSIRKNAAMIAEQDGTSLNYFISVAIAEKVSRMASLSSAANHSTQHDAPRRALTPSFT